MQSNSQTAAVLTTNPKFSNALPQSKVSVFHNDNRGRSEQTEGSTTPNFGTVRERFHRLISTSPSKGEAAVGMLSLLQQVTHGFGDAQIDEFLSQMHAPGVVSSIFNHLYDESRQALLSLSFNTEQRNVDSVPIELWFEQFEFLLQWIEQRSHSMEKTEGYRLGDENFFNIRLLDDVQKHGIFGVTLRTGINLDSRGDRNLFLQVKVLSGGMPLQATDTFGTWKEDDTDHFIIEQPLITRGLSSCGRVIVDTVDLFVPYEALQWPEKKHGTTKRTAEVVFLCTILTQNNEPVCSERVPHVIRVIRSDTNHNKDLALSNHLISPRVTGLFERCPIQGHAIDSCEVALVEGELSITTSVTVLNKAVSELSLYIRVIDSESEAALYEQSYALRPLTNVATFDDITATVPLTYLGYDSLQEVSNEQIEIVLTETGGKVICGTCFPVKSSFAEQM